MELKIQFIITGWYYNQDTLIDGLIDINNNKEVDVFFACHNEPPNKIKNNFNWYQFPNIGLEWGAYDQALEYLNLVPNTVCFFLQDDLIIKDWEFINECVNKLNSGIKFIGNGTNYPNHINPADNSKLGSYSFKDLVKKSHRHLFDCPMGIKTIRGSFLCTLYDYLKNINGFEPMFHIEHSLTPIMNKENRYEMPGMGGIGGVGNTQLTLFAYKINRIYGENSISYLSPRYLDSDFIYECARGTIDNNNPMT
jgi:hypothetical protein